MSRPTQSNARQIASLLMQILHLPEDNSLVPLFGTGHEENNLDAITQWVETQLHEIDDIEVTLHRLQKKHATFKAGGCHASR